jgi:asparagine synthase (glutamine-hydrolysing)
VADSILPLPRIRKYVPLMSAEFPRYYFSRTSNPFLYAGNGLGKLYSPQFADTVNRERSVEPVRRFQSHVEGENTLNAMLYIDTKTWLPDDLLIKADKMTMANSVELRVPLLDHKVLEFAAAVPANLKVRGFTTKYLAKTALQQRVPREILNRRKVGFPVPYEGWLRSELRDWVRDILLDPKTRDRGYFDSKKVEKLLASGQSDSAHAKEIFSLTTLELWHRAFAC